jgi:hypothetical protein
MPITAIELNMKINNILLTEEKAIP